MAKIISEITPDGSDVKVVEIKHTSTMKDASGNDIEVLDYTSELNVDDAITQCEAHKANLQAQLTECETELADLIAIRDAE